MVVSADEDTLRPLALVPAPQVALVEALEEDAMASVEVSAEAAVAVVVLEAVAIADSAVAVEVALAEVAAVVAVTVALVNKTAMALLLMHQQVLATAAVIGTGTAMVLAVGMTVVVAHMMTGRDVTAADMAATVTDAAAAVVAAAAAPATPTTNLSVATEEAVISTSPETMTDLTAGNVDSREDMKTLASCAVTRWVSWWWVSSIFTLTSKTYISDVPFFL